MSLAMDSPGHSAKNCIYTLMDTDSDYILHVEVVDVWHSQLKSACMEKVGCQRALDFLMSQVEVDEFITDALSQIIKMLGNKISNSFPLSLHVACIYYILPNTHSCIKSMVNKAICNIHSKIKSDWTTTITQV
jgi:hypothetical protein